MPIGTIIDLSVVLLALALCGVWIWWDERDRRRRREQAAARLQAAQEILDLCNNLHQKSDSGGNHPG
jgi:hypothetical protein